MRGNRHYPDEPAGPFPRPPTTLEDDEGRTITVSTLSADPSTLEELTEMYVRFHPEDRAQGIPPTGESSVRTWLEPIVADGLNVGARSEPDSDEPASGEASASTIVGHATLVPERGRLSDLADPGSVEWELAIFVLQAYQRAGIGTALVEHLLGAAAARGIDRVWLTVEPWNGPAISLYERVGFETVDADSFDREMTIRLPPETTG